MITGIHHVSRGVGDMDRSLAFYRDLLGMEVVLDTEMAGEMLDRETGLAGATLRFVLLRGSGTMPFLELLQYPAPAGVRFNWPPQEVDSGTLRGHWTAYCFDPDGLIIELWQLPGTAVV